MIKTLLAQYITPEKLNKQASELSAQLNQHELQPGEMKPLFVLNPHGGKLMINIITLKEENGEVKYSRQIDSKELTLETFAEMLNNSKF